MQIPAGKHANPWSQKDKFHQLGFVSNTVYVPFFPNEGNPETSWAQ
jgi:hypothetical protein